MALEVVREAADREIKAWRDAGFGTDAPVIAAAIDAEVDCLCTGDRKLQRELATYNLAIVVLSPSALLDVLRGR
jgi:hypothetical protein